jgi:hypothetical protein
MQDTSNQLKEEFLQRLSRLDQGFLTRRKWEVANKVQPNWAFNTYEDCIENNYFDLAAVVKLLGRFYETKLPIDETRLSARLTRLLRKERKQIEGSDHKTVPVFFLRDATECVEHMVRSFKEAIEWVREESLLGSPRHAEESTESDKADNKFDPADYGGVVSCIVVSYFKDGQHDTKRLKRMIKNKTSHKEIPSDVKQWSSRIRAKARKKDWYAAIPAHYWQSYDPKR